MIRRTNELGGMAGDPARSEMGGPAAWIPGYRVVLFLDSGRSSIVVIDAASDDDALALATEIAKGRAFELWDALTRIGQSPPRDSSRTSGG